jgi:hypothetical protein
MPGKKTYSLHIKNGQLWPSTLYAGPAVIKFITSPSGRFIKVTVHGVEPRHKRLAKPTKKRYNNRRG